MRPTLQTRRARVACPRSRARRRRRGGWDRVRFKELSVSETKSSKPFRLGLIGAGGISHMHAKHARRIEGVEIAAAADVSEKALEKFKEALPEVTTCTV